MQMNESTAALAAITPGTQQPYVVTGMQGEPRSELDVSVRK